MGDIPLGLLLGIALRPLPKVPLQAALSLVMRTMAQRHPAVFERLTGLGDVTVCIDPTDLPYQFAFRPNAAGDRLRLIERGDGLQAAATIRGKLSVLLSLLQGRADGDALFFNRALLIEGDTAAVVAMRNAIDNADVDLLADLPWAFGAAVGQAFGPAGGPAGWLAERMMRLPIRLGTAFARDLAAWQSAIVAPISREQSLLATTLQQLERRLETLSGELHRAKKKT